MLLHDYLLISRRFFKSSVDETVQQAGISIRISVAHTFCGTRYSSDIRDQDIRSGCIVGSKSGSPYVLGRGSGRDINDSLQDSVEGVRGVHS